MSYTAVARDIQSITRNPKDNDDTMIFPPRFTCLSTSYVPVVAIHPLGGSRANRHHRPNPQLGAAQPTQDGDQQATSNPLKMPFMISHGEGSRTPHNQREVAKNNHQLLPTLLHCSKLFRRRQTPKSNKKTTTNWSLSATRCNHSSKCTLDHFQLT